MFKVHKNHPLKITHSSINHVHIYPTSEDRVKRPRMPAEVFRDKMDHDLAAFMMLPFNMDIEKEKTLWEKIAVIEDGFIPHEGSNQEKQPASIIYLPHGLNLKEGIYKVSEVMPSFVGHHLFY